MTNFRIFKSTLSRVILIILLIVVVCCVVSAVILGKDGTPLTGDQLFEEFVLNPKPESVKVIDSYDGGPDYYPNFCLHFELSTDDFQRILASKDWNTVSEAPYIALDCGPSNPTWDFIFPPPLLKENITIYTYYPNERDFELLFVNSAKNEAYYYYHDGYMH